MTKRILFSVVTAVITGAVTLIGYKLFFEKPEVTIIKEEPSSWVRLASGTAVAEGVNFVDAAEFALPTVVHVKTATPTRRRPMNPIEEFFFGPQPQRPQIQRGTGSGVIVSPDGYIVTNNHVIANAAEIEVVLNDGKELPARVVGTDPSTDLALIKVDYTDLTPAIFANSDAVRVGEWVLALGNPFNLTNTVTHGIISAKGRSINIINRHLQGANTAIEAFIQTDAAVNPGNSGGALVNTRGELIGINTAISSRSGSFEGYSFAIPSNIVKKVMEDIVEFGVVQRAFIGVQIAELSQTKARELKLENRNGVLVTGLSKGGAAEEAGLKEDDVIVSVDGYDVRTPSQLQERIGRKRPGDSVTVEVLRKGKSKQYDLILRNEEGTTDVLEKDVIASELGLGAEFQEIEKDDKERLNVKGGLKITELRSGKLMREGVPEGFIITHVERKPVSTVDELKSILKDLKKGQGVMIEGRYQDGRRGFFAFEW
ncbi:MAG: Do family serine endopeptidase [Cryomorphaceae bacterium]|nr:Do family serine endopeptidase [Cryomorphaceae bacterium]